MKKIFSREYAIRSVAAYAHAVDSGIYPQLVTDALDMCGCRDNSAMRWDLERELRTLQRRAYMGVLPDMCSRQDAEGCFAEYVPHFTTVKNLHDGTDLVARIVSHGVFAVPHIGQGTQHDWQMAGFEVRGETGHCYCAVQNTGNGAQPLDVNDVTQLLTLAEFMDHTEPCTPAPGKAQTRTLH